MAHWEGGDFFFFEDDGGDDGVGRFRHMRP